MKAVKYKIVKKSICEKKHHLENRVAECIIKKKNKIFIETDKILPQVNINSKIMISINFIIKKYFKQ